MAGVVAVFGGTGRLGTAVVEAIAATQPVHFTTFSKTAEAEALVTTLRAAGADIEFSQVDVRKADAVETLLARLAQTRGLAGVASANGAPFPVGPLYEASEQDFRRIAEVDIFGSFHILQSATRHLATAGGGSIVLFLTAAVLRSAVWDGMSSITKAAVAGMIRQMARDAGPLNVRVNGVAPGVAQTDKLADLSVLSGHKRELVDAFIRDTPLPRLNDIRSIAAMTAFLLSPVAADISGQIIGTDGGYSA